MTDERVVVLICTGDGQHAKASVLARLVIRDGIVVDLMQQGYENVRQALMAQQGRPADFDRSCRQCRPSRNPRATAPRLLRIVTAALAADPDARRVTIDISNPALPLF